MDCFCQIHPHLLISDWCAKIYPHSYRDGWEQVIPETNMLDLIGDDNNVGLLNSFSTDIDFLLGYNDQASSLSCNCQGMIKTPTHLEAYF